MTNSGGQDKGNARKVGSIRRDRGIDKSRA